VSYQEVITTVPAEPELVHGEFAAGFAAVRDVFAGETAELGGGGAAFAAVVDGDVVVDLWAGRSGPGPWRRETRGVLMSATKGVVATAVACLADRGALDIELPVATYWPEFAVAGKADISVAQLLSHSAGLVSVPGYEDLLSPDGAGWNQTAEIVHRLEAAAPAWPPGSAHGYHGLTFGWLVGELVRRVTGSTVGTIIRDEISTPLGLELDLGTLAHKQHLVAPVILPRPRPQTVVSADEEFVDRSLLSQMFLTVEGRSILDTADTFFADSGRLAIELPGSNATGTARALARLYGALSGGGCIDDARLLSPSAVEVFSAERMRGRDRMTGIEVRWALGFQLPVPPEFAPAGNWPPRHEAFGHDGYGGQFGFADPVTGAGVGFVRSELSGTSPLGPLLVTAFYECLESR
jgi:CubicO group peptidase (beta-lactamase class C family)